VRKVPAREISHTEIYEKFYTEIVNENLVGFFSKIFHKQMESFCKHSERYEKVLELGAAEGEHFPFVRHDFSEYIQSDIRYSDGNQSKLSESGKVITKRRIDAHNLSVIESNSIDRLIVTCLIVHLIDIPRALSEWRRVIKNGGLITIYVHCEPGMLLRLAQFVSTRRKFQARGVNYYEWQYTEHVTYFLRAKMFIEKIFASDNIAEKGFPFSFLSWNFSLWKIYQIRIQK
jgi:ubiquinone/menaquinone biosynthesis C-methylase UbiE